VNFIRTDPMPFSEALAARIRPLLARRRKVEERKMFGGVVFLFGGHMGVGVWQDSLVVRVGPEQYEGALKQPFVGEFDITGRPMTGWVLVSPEGVEDDDQLQEWIERAVKFVKTLPKK
jgi:TfoX/Sxy family transcriptional regulator of competence genes